MELFEVIKNIFNNKKGDWEKISKFDKSRNFFMINRIMSIHFPTQANQFNKLKVTPNLVVDWWHDILSQKYNRPPNWIYTKTNKKDKTKTKEEIKDFSLIEDHIRDRYNIDKRDMTTIKKFFPEKYKLWLLDISDQIGNIKKDI